MTAAGTTRPARPSKPAMVRETVLLIRRDAARWVRPQQVAAPEEVTFGVAVRLLMRQPSLRATTWFRIGTLARNLRIRGVPAWSQRRLLRLYGIELVPGAVIGGGFYVAHPVGCVLVADRIGEDVTVIGQATFGTRDDHRWPTLGDRVFVGVGARVLGGVHVSDDARIGANAVVLQDVPAGTSVVGVPARDVGTLTGGRR